MTRSQFSFLTFRLFASLVFTGLLLSSSVTAQEDSDEKQIAQQRFNEADTDQSGAISKTEFTAYVKSKLDWFKQIDKLMTRLDADKNDEISPEEFLNRKTVINQIIDEEDAPPKKPTEFQDIYNQNFLKRKPLLGDTIKDVVAFDGEGNEFNFKDLRGKYTVINFGCLT